MAKSTILDFKKDIENLKYKMEAASLIKYNNFKAGV